MTRLSQELFDFIKENAGSDPVKLRLKGYGKKYDFDYEFGVIQIACRNKHKKKLGKFMSNERFLFPSELSAEQATNEVVAQFHADIVGKCDSLLDMTAGLGMDVLTFSGRCKEVIACELDELKAEILRFNCETLRINNISVKNTDSIKWLEENNRRFDVIYIDPARRNAENARVYNFHDCQPDIIKFQELLSERCRRLFIKASPLLDINQTLKDINNIVALRVVCVSGECKEVLVEVSSEFDGTILFEAVDLSNQGKIVSRYSFREPCDNVLENQERKTDIIVYAEKGDIIPGSYLYEPNAAIMKLAPWKQLADKYKGLKKFDISSHLFVSQYIYEDFPGRILSIEKLIDKKERKTLKDLPLNVVVRNYPLSAVQLRKELKVKEGSDGFIYGSRIKDPVLILAKRLDQNFKPAESTI